MADGVVWNTNIASGTHFILAAFNNGPYGNGGSSALMTVGESSNSGCLDDSSPSSTPAVPMQTGTGTTTSGPTRTGGGIKTVTAIATAQPRGAAGYVSLSWLGWRRSSEADDQIERGSYCGNRCWCSRHCAHSSSDPNLVLLSSTTPCSCFTSSTNAWSRSQTGW